MSESDPPAATPPPRRRAATEKALRRRSRREQHAGKRKDPPAATDPRQEQPTAAAARERRTRSTTRRTDAARTDAKRTDTGRTESGSRRTGARTEGSSRTDGRSGRADGGSGRADGGSSRTDRGAGRTDSGRGRDRRAGAGPRREHHRPPGRPSGRRERRSDREQQPARPSRRRVLVRRWVALGVLAGGVGVVVALLFTPLLGVRDVTVSGMDGLTADQVRAQAAISPGTPMLRLDVAGIMARVATLPRVAAVDVSRNWLDTVHIAVTERDPVGVVNRPDGMHLVDVTGLDYATVRAVPAGLPTITLPHIAPNDPLTHAVVAVLANLPAPLKSQVVSVTAPSPGGVTLVLASGKSVRWGGATDAARKAAVLGALLTQPGKLYDVSSPDLPTISS